jgi:hypothetical protein
MSPARDFYHNAVKNALIKDGWTITQDPLRLSIGTTAMYVDLGAERLLAAEKGMQKIAVEVKSFIGDSPITDLERALGQYVVYKAVLKKTEPDRVLYVAVPEHVLKDIFDEPLGRLLLEENIALIVGFDPQQEVIVKWLP